VPYKPVLIPPDCHLPDMSIAQAMFFTGLGSRTIQRLCTPQGDQPPRVESYLLAGARRIVFANLKRYRDECRDAGPQLGLKPSTGKRPVGRPRKKQPAAAE